MNCTVCNNESKFSFPLCNSCYKDELVCIYGPNISYNFGIDPRDKQFEKYNLTFIKIPNDKWNEGYYLISELENACDDYYKDYKATTRREGMNKWRYFKNKKNREQIRLDREKLNEKKNIISTNVIEILKKYEFENKKNYVAVVDAIIDKYCKDNPGDDISSSINNIVELVVTRYSKKMNNKEVLTNH